jgi:hypothetical protein
MTDEEIKALIDDACSKLDAKIDAIVEVLNAKVSTHFKKNLLEHTGTCPTCGRRWEEPK